MNRTSVGCTERCFTVAPGRSQTVKLTFTRSTAALNTYAGGQLTWSDGTHKVLIPAVLRPVVRMRTTRCSSGCSGRPTPGT